MISTKLRYSRPTKQRPRYVYRDDRQLPRIPLALTVYLQDNLGSYTWGFFNSECYYRQHFYNLAHDISSRYFRTCWSFFGRHDATW